MKVKRSLSLPHWALMALQPGLWRGAHAGCLRGALAKEKDMQYGALWMVSYLGDHC